MGTGKKKIEIKRIEKESRRMVTFSKRRKGLFKKAHELHSMSNSDIALLVLSPTGKPYIHGDPNFEGIIDNYLRTVDGRIEDDEANMWKECLELGSVDVEAYENVEELVLLRNRMEEIKWKLVQRIEDEVTGSFFV